MSDTDASTLLSGIPREVQAACIAGAELVHLPANVPPWSTTSLDVEAGDEITLLASGRVALSEELGLSGGPRLYLWGRIGSRGSVWNGAQDTHTLRAEESGRLGLAIYQGEWANRQGDLATPTDVYAALSGALDVAVIRWKHGAREGLEALAAAGCRHPLLEAERERLAHPVERPDGWDYLWFLGPADIFTRRSAEGRDAIAARTRDDVGILQHPVDVPLRDDTKICWSWQMDELPSQRAEDQLLHHDYLSLALEFDNGLDLTWYWSAALPVGTSYACPIPTWNARETHRVVRSGPDGLGEWHAEERPVLADYRESVGGPDPSRIVSVWLIAVSLFQHRAGAGTFADIELRSGNRRTPVR